MRKDCFAIAVALSVLAAFAAPKKPGNAVPVAEGYPAWTGVTPKNHLYGRQFLDNADLRQHITVVVEVDAEKAHEQLDLAGELTQKNFSPVLVKDSGRNWETLELPHDVLVIFVVRNLKDRAAFRKAIRPVGSKQTPGLWTIESQSGPIYADVTFEGAPDSGGKLPFAYVMGTEGKEPLFQGPFDAKAKGAIDRAIWNHKKALKEMGVAWRPFYGYVAEPKHFTGLDKLIKAGKPLETFETKLLKGVASKDPEVAKEAQMLYDGLVQTRDDFICLATCEAGPAPHVAAYHMGQVVKYWPKVKKQLSEVADALKANADAKSLVAMYPRVAAWADPDFTCKNAGEAKKIVAELNKMKKMLEPLKEKPDNIAVQNGALIVDGMIDELIATIPSKVPQG